MRRVGVIDLGSNTFHLLIVEMRQGEWTPLVRDRVFVKLASEGVERIGDGPYLKGIETMVSFAEQLINYEVASVRAIGTAALRTASNGPQFLDEVLEKTNISIELISGQEEARFIYKGVRQMSPLPKASSGDKMLIMDIGGGSVEFILCDDTQMYFAESFPIGVSVLYRAFHHADPLSSHDFQAIQSFLGEQLQPLIALKRRHAIQALIGASGTFDVLAAAFPKGGNANSFEIDMVAYKPWAKSLIGTTANERSTMEEIPAQRADLIVVAVVLIDFVLDMLGVEKVYYTDYALKEGVLSEM